MSAKGERTAWLRGGKAKCPDAPRSSDKLRRLVLLGAPGVGKGTQAEMLAAGLGACHLSTGDVFRAAKTIDPGERSPALKQALEFMARGELVPDATVLDLLRERVDCLRCAGGFLLDGFPHTVAQAEALDAILKQETLALDAVINYEMPIDAIVARLSGRRTCKSCKAVFHVTSRPPKLASVCDHCGGELVLREDDRPEAVKVRMEAYHRSTAPLADYYGRKGLLLAVPADGAPEEIYGRTLKALEARA